MRKGSILADEMGLGKTVQVIATLLHLGPTKDMPCLIICPTSLIANWCNEISKFAPSLDIIVHRGGERAGVTSSLKMARIVLSTYETMVSDETLLRGIHWSIIICDEAQAIKNPESIRRMVVASLFSNYRLLMTGTPVEVSLKDIWSLMDICVPSILGNLEKFEIDFPNTQESAINLNKLVSPLILRRTVADVAKDLPDRIDVPLPLELDQKQALEYEKIRKLAFYEYRNAGALVATARLSVFCAFPRADFSCINLENPEDIIFDMTDLQVSMTPKLEVTRLLIEEAIASNKKVIVFSNYNHISVVLKSVCRDSGIGYWNKINGSTPQESRQKIIDEFSATLGSAVLILNPKAAGSGLNITAATVVIHYTPVWNPALEMQASARAHRRGQTQPVTIYQLYYKNTVEQVMIERARFRKELGDRVIPDLSQDTDDLNKAMFISPITEEKFLS
jgi:SNF2 family DNA or RNA helicase